MVNRANQNSIQFSWADILWRLLLTLLLLLALAGPGLTIFKTVTSHPETEILPPLVQEKPAGPPWLSRP